MSHPSKSLWRAAFAATAPIFVGYFFVGIAFGLLLQRAGYAWGWALLSSLVVYAGSMQFVLVDLLAHPGGMLSAALLTLAVNIRHVVYGLSMIEPFAKMGRRKPYMIFSLTDETYSLLCAAKCPPGASERSFFFRIALLDHCYWILGSVVGATIGELMTVDTTGIDFAMTAFFVVVFVDQWKSSRCRIPALIGLVSAGGAVLLFGLENFLPFALGLMTLALLLFRRPLEARFDRLNANAKEETQ